MALTPGEREMEPTKKPGSLEQVASGTNQLLVVTSDGWDKATGQMRVFEHSGQGSPWQAVPAFDWAVNLGSKGMGWGGGRGHRTSRGLS